MKRVTLPKPQELVGTGPDGKPTLTLIGLPELLDAQIWPLKYWRNGTSDRLHMVLRLSELFKVGQPPGTEVDLQNRDHESVVEAAMSVDLKGPNTLPVLKLFCALTDAKDVEEDKKP